MTLRAYSESSAIFLQEAEELEETFETVTRDELFLVIDNIFPGVKFCCSQNFF